MKTLAIILLTIFLTSITTKTTDDFTGQAYNSKSAADKAAQLLAVSRENQTPYGWYSAISFTGIFIESMSPSFDYESDKMPDGRKKYIHSVGSVGQVNFVSTGDHPYTGVFKGCDHVILRLSTAASYDKTKNTAAQAAANFIPGFGIKFLRDSRPSANLVAMYGVDGQSSWNYFAFSFSNHIAPAKTTALKVASLKFAEAQKETGIIGVKALADYDCQGNQESNSVFPYKLDFQPTAEAKAMFTDDWSAEVLDQLDTIPVGMAIYDVMAIAEPNEPSVKIGTLTVTDEFRRSYWGDRYMFFKHNYIADDYVAHPTWQQMNAVEFKAFMTALRGLYH